MAKMVKEIQTVQDILKKDQLAKIDGFLECCSDANALVELAGRGKKEEIAQTLGMTRQSLYRRVAKGDWQPTELRKLFKHFGIKS